MMSENKKVHLEKVDVLRGVAIILVFLFHTQLELYPETISQVYTDKVLHVDSLKQLILNFSPSAYGWSGVTLFFIISGFLIHLGTLSASKKFSISTFYSKRFWRIYPVYIIALLFLCFSRNQTDFYLLNKEGLIHFISHVFLIHNFSETTIYSINGSFWSLAVEVQLYLLYPLLVFSRKHISIANWFNGLLFLAVVIQIAGIFNPEMGKALNLLNIMIAAWASWCGGALIAEKYTKNQRLFSFNNVGLIMCVFIVFIASRGFEFTAPFNGFFGMFGWMLLFEKVMFGQINIPKFIYKGLSLVGLCSYSFYLIHQPFLGDLLKYFSFMNIPVLATIVVFLVIFFISYSLFKILELRFIAFGERLRSRRLKQREIRLVVKDPDFKIIGVQQVH